LWIEAADYLGKGGSVEINDLVAMRWHIVATIRHVVVGSVHRSAPWLHAAAYVAATAQEPYAHGPCAPVIHLTEQLCGGSQSGAVCLG
jgi:hypothetical protein